MSVGLKGLQTPGNGETRDIGYLEVIHNGNTYDWMIYIPVGANLGEYLTSVENEVYAEIDYKEGLWANTEPKTKTVFDPLTNEQTTVPILKEEIVKPDYPDYYAKRRGEYPSVGDQLGALTNGNASPTLQEISDKIQAVKAKYPKPPWITAP